MVTGLVPLARLLAGPAHFFFSCFFFHRSCLDLLNSSLQTRIHETLRSLLNSCTGLRNAAFASKSRWDVFSVCSTNPSGMGLPVAAVLAILILADKVRRTALVREEKRAKSNLATFAKEFRGQEDENASVVCQSLCFRAFHAPALSLSLSASRILCHRHQMELYSSLPAYLRSQMLLYHPSILI